MNTLLRKTLMCILGGSTLVAGESRRLVDTEINMVIASYEGGKLRIHDKILEAELREFGIRVPYAKRGEYQGREFVFLGEEGFEQAFCALYVKDAMDSRFVRWTD